MKVFILLRDGDRWQDCPTIESARVTAEEAEAYCVEQEQHNDQATDPVPHWYFLEVDMPLAVAHELVTP